MSAPTRKNAPTTLSLRHAFEVEQARREAERYAREEAERRQQEEDLARAEQLYDALIGDPASLAAHHLTADWRRYTVLLESPDFRIRAYFEAGRGKINVDRIHQFARVLDVDPYAILAAVEIRSPGFAVACAEQKLMTLFLVKVPMVAMMTSPVLPGPRLPRPR